jgi:hypothetical protein
LIDKDFRGTARHQQWCVLPNYRTIGTESIHTAQPTPKQAIQRLAKAFYLLAAQILLGSSNNLEIHL